jgi:hypothetical protein
VTAIGGRIPRDALAGPWTLGDDPGELMTQDKGLGEAGVTDARLLVPMQIRAAQPHGGHSKQNLSRTRNLGRLNRDTYIATAVDSGSFDECLAGDHFRRCP